MEKIMNRPKNADVGKPLRDRRVPVQMTQDEYDRIQAAADAVGQTVSGYLRTKALESANGD